MKSHDLAHLMELATNILRSLPNSDLPQALKTIQKLVDNNQSPNIKKTQSHSIELPKDIRKKLSLMSAQDIENYLNTDPLFISTASIQKLAEELDIQISRRQSRNALVNLIVRHQESSQMDSLIRSGSKNDVDMNPN